MINILSVQSSSEGVSLQNVSVDPNILPEGYSSMVTMGDENNCILYAYNKTLKQTDVYQITGDAPFITKLISNSTDLDLYEFDNLKTFVLGNKPYLMGYESKGGFFAFYEINKDHTLSKPYLFSNMRSWPTQNFSETEPFVATGLLYVLGYDDVKGTVAIFSLDVVSSSAGGVPPLNMLNVWYHQWAKGWEDFSFFQLGQSNFFFKINKSKLNVNIDHVLDNPAMGTVEIGSYLQKLLPNALDVSLSVIVPWSNGEPYLATYDTKAKSINFYNIHADCQGWTNLNTTPVPASSQMLSYRLNNISYILLYA